MTVDRVKGREYEAAYRARHPEKYRVIKKRWRDGNPGMNRVNKWRSQGIDLTDEGYDELLAEQDGRCAVCMRTQSKFKRSFVPDHIHPDGPVRGLLCGPCNRALGLFGEDVERLRCALAYLETNGVPVRQD